MGSALSSFFTQVFCHPGFWPGGWHYLCAFTGKLKVMRTLRFPLFITVLTLASVFQVQAQALYKPTPETSPTVPYYSCIRSSGAQIYSDDPLQISSYDAMELIKSLYPREFRTSRVQLGVGISLVALGMVSAVTGLMFYVVAVSVPKDEYGPFSFIRGWGGAGTYCTGCGIIAFCGGLVLMSNSRKTVERIVDDYHSTYGPGYSYNLSFRPTSNGVGLVLAF